MTRKSQNYLLLTLVFISSVLTVFADEVKLRPENFTHLTIEDGLPQNNVRCVEEDIFGFLWICTSDGLVRYDGYEFELITDGTDGSRISNTIIRVIQSDDNNLWIGTEYGINKFNLYDGTFETYLLSEVKQSSNNIRALEVTKDKLFIGTGDGLYILDKSSGIIIKEDLPKKYSNIRSLKITNNFLYIGGYRAGILKYSLKKLKVTKSYKDHTNNNILTINYINNKLWIGLYGGGYYTLDSNFENKGASVACNESNRLCEGTADIFNIKENDGIIVLSSSSGIYQLDVTSENIVAQISLPQYIKNPYITNYIKDATQTTNNEWFFSLSPGGVVKLNFQEESFTHFKMLNAYNGIDDIYAIEGYRNNIYAGTYNGLMKLNDVQEISKVQIENNNYSNNHSFRISALKTVADRLFIGSYDGLYFLTENEGKHKLTKINIDIQVTSLEKDDSNNIWVGTSKGEVFRISASLNIYNYPKINALSLEYINELSIKKDSLLIGSMSNGLAIYNTITTDVITYDIYNSDIRSNSIISSYQSNDIAWIGTRGDGLKRLNLRTRVLSSYDFLSSKIGNTVYSIEGDDVGVIWVSTNNGIVAINPSNLNEKHFTVKTGLLDKEYNHNASYFIDEHMYFGGSKGITKINTSLLNRHTKQEGIVSISKMTIQLNHGNKVITRYGPKISIVEIDHDASLKFNLTNNLKNTANIQNYEYKLQESNKDSYWVAIKQGNRVLHLDRLKSGNYTLSLKAKDFNNRSLKTKIIKIIVKPPLWLTNIAILSYILLFLSLTFYIVKTYIKVKVTNEKNLFFKTEIENRKKNIATLSHDLRTPLNAIVMLSDTQIRFNKNNQNVIYSSAMLLRSMISNALDQSLLETGTNIEIKISKVDLLKSLTSLTEILRLHFESKSINLLMHLNIDPDMQYYTDKTRLEQICLNVITNAIKHSPEGSDILLSASMNNNILEIKVKNKGKEIPLEERDNIFQPFYKAKDNNESGVGLGLYISKKIANRLGGEILINDNVKDGTEFILTIPNVTNQVPESYKKSSTLINTNHRVLMIDDDPFNRLAFSTICKNLNIQCKVISSVCEFNKIDEIYDFYFLDLNLGGESINGIELANLMEEKGILSPKILLTADVRADELICDSGISECLIKPIIIEDLISIINAFTS